MNPSWLTQMKDAVESLDKSSAPSWLKNTLRDALEVAPDLAPRSEPEYEPAPSFYPH